MRRVEWWAAPVALVGLLLVPVAAVGLALHRVRRRKAPRRLSDKLRAEGVLGEATEYEQDWAA